MNNEKENPATIKMLEEMKKDQTKEVFLIKLDYMKECVQKENYQEAQTVARQLYYEFVFKTTKQGEIK